MDPNEDRPSPEELLRAVEQEEGEKKKGKLKIFLGMAAGVGKTFTMLEEAQKLQKEGVDIVVGIVNTHGRIETAKLLNGLKQIPEKTILYKDKEFKELDVDAIIKLQPEIVLVDELAHNNTPGSNHAKRWQDVIEILDHGINVFSTLNVQHIESLNDIVRGITTIAVRETVPDLIIEKASSIQLVDLTPDELLERLREGKVYLGDQSAVAIRNFFQKDKLTALREIVLRYAADKIDLDLRRMIPIKEGVIEWKPREKLLVAINHAQAAQKLIRLTRRLAANLDASWIVLHVNNGTFLTEQETAQLAKNIALGRDLGAEVITINDPSVAEGIKRTALHNGVTQIVLGREPRSRINTILQGESLLNWLVKECKDIDIHVIRQEKYTVSMRKKISEFASTQKLTDYLLVSLVVCALSYLCWLYSDQLDYRIIGVVFLFSIVGISLFFKKGPIIFASFLFAMIWNYFFIEPVEELSIASREDYILNILFFLTGITIGIIVDRVRENQEMLAKSERTTAALYDIARHLSSNLTTEEMLAFLQTRLKKHIEGTYEFIIKKVEGGIQFDDTSKIVKDDKEKSAAIWTFESGKESGWSTDTLPSAKNLYLPLKGYHDVMGVLAFRPAKDEMLSIEDKNFLYTVAQQLSSYIERAHTVEKAKQQEYLHNVEQIYNTILKRFSLAFSVAMITTKSALVRLKGKLDGKLFPELIELDAALEIFLKVMDNITAMAQLSETMVPLRKSRQYIGELAEECAKDAQEITKEQIIETKIEPDLPMISFDYHMMQILLQNLLLNAIEYSPPGSVITVGAREENGMIQVSVIDEGPGIPEEQMDMIFEKFYIYRGQEEKAPGMGLGLAIAKTIAELHDGHLRADNLPGSGAKFTLTLPIQ